MADNTDILVSDLLTDMGTLSNEIEIGAGGADEVRAINALNMSLRYCYMIAASIKKVLSTIGPTTIQTTPNQEFTPKPSQLLRSDSLWACSATDNVTPVWEMHEIQEVGGHRPSLPWPLNWAVSPANGQPFAYYQDQSNWFWLPAAPATVYYMRSYGLWLPPKFVDRNSPIGLPGNAGFFLGEALCAFALKRLKMSVDDPTDVIQQHAVEVFTPALTALRHQDRSRAGARQYAYTHST